MLLLGVLLLLLLLLLLLPLLPLLLLLLILLQLLRATGHIYSHVMAEQRRLDEQEAAEDSGAKVSTAVDVRQSMAM